MGDRAVRDGVQSWSRRRRLLKRVMRGILMTGNWIISLTQERGKQHLMHCSGRGELGDRAVRDGVQSWSRRRRLLKRVMREILMTGNWIISLTQERGKHHLVHCGGRWRGGLGDRAVRWPGTGLYHWLREKVNSLGNCGWRRKKKGYPSRTRRRKLLKRVMRGILMTENWILSLTQGKGKVFWGCCIQL